MPILNGSISFSRFQIVAKEKPPSYTAKWWSKALTSNAFEPIDRRSDEEQSSGFAELENSKLTEFSPGALFRGERALFCWRVDTLKINASQLKEELSHWVENFERENNRRANKSEKTKARSELREVLRKRAQVVTKTHDIACNMKTGHIQIWSTSRKTIDDIAVAIQNAFDVTLEPVSPSFLAQQVGLKQDTLAPTPSLFGVMMKDTRHVEN